MVYMPRWHLDPMYIPKYKIEYKFLDRSNAFDFLGEKTTY